MLAKPQQTDSFLLPRTTPRGWIDIQSVDPPLAVVGDQHLFLKRRIVRSNLAWSPGLRFTDLALTRTNISVGLNRNWSIVPIWIYISRHSLQIKLADSGNTDALDNLDYTTTHRLHGETADRWLPACLERNASYASERHRSVNWEPANTPAVRVER